MLIANGRTTRICSSFVPQKKSFLRLSVLLDTLEDVVALCDDNMQSRQAN